jgi:type 1 glutamine amidotransferase
MVNILVLCDDYWHPAEVIELGIAPLKEKYNFTIIKSAKDILTPEMITNYPVILCCKGNNINSSNTAPWFEDGVTEVCPKEFEEYVRKGGSFLSVHSSNTSKPGDAYTDFVGNYFNGHPPRCHVNVNMLPNHPITNEVEDFAIRDEHYNIVITASDAEIFCKSNSADGGEQIAGYTRNIGEGRLCVLTPGHTTDVWYNKMFQRLLCNAIDWCSQVKML